MGFEDIVVFIEVYFAFGRSVDMCVCVWLVFKPRIPGSNTFHDIQLYFGPSHSGASDHSASIESRMFSN